MLTTTQAGLQPLRVWGSRLRFCEEDVLTTAQLTSELAGSHEHHVHVHNIRVLQLSHAVGDM